MANKKAEHWIKVEIPVSSVTELGFHPHAAKYEAEVLRYFSPSTDMRWFGSGSTGPLQTGKVEKLLWDFGVRELENAIESFKRMFRDRSFPDGTTITKVTKHADYSLSFQTLLTWSARP